MTGFLACLPVHSIDLSAAAFTEMVRQGFHPDLFHDLALAGEPLQRVGEETLLEGRLQLRYAIEEFGGA